MAWSQGKTVAIASSNSALFDLASSRSHWVARGKRGCLGRKGYEVHLPVEPVPCASYVRTHLAICTTCVTRRDYNAATLCARADLYLNHMQKRGLPARH
eukprot:263551-Amphidinium_carterae.1